MRLTSTPRASSDWLATWPKRPKPITSTLPCRPAGSSTPSVSTGITGNRRRVAIRTTGVSTIERMTAAVATAFSRASITPAETAAPYRTKANSPPWANSAAR